MSTERARRLRRDGTQAERVLWSKLRNRQLENQKFRRQVPVGSYIVDFQCLVEHLIVELDGGQHGTDEGRASDARRTRFLEARGFLVIRFWNNDVLENIEGVLIRISETLGNR